MTDKSNVVNLVSPKPKENVKGYIRIEYINSTPEVIQCDSFGASEELPGFLVLWSDSSEEMIGFIRADAIKKLIILKDDPTIKPGGYSLSDNS